MFSIIKLSERFFFLSRRQNLLNALRPFSYCKMRFCNSLFQCNTRNSVKYKTIIAREKSSIKKTRRETEEEEEENEDESDEEVDDQEFHFKGDEIKTYDIQAARIDKILKVCLKISRKNIEDLFYQTRIRLNGKILMKKSANARIGDEIDIINGFVNENSKLINVNRIEIVNIKEDPDNLRYSVKIKKSKALIIENYNGCNKWKG